MSPSVSNRTKSKFQPNFVKAKIARGTKNFTRGAAMSDRAMQTAIETGIKLARAAKLKNTKIIGLGEMGIGNTTVASATAAALRCGADFGTI